MQFDRVDVLRVSFRIPAHWAEEHEEDHSLFYDPQKRDGFLRVSVVTFRGDASPDRVRRIVSNAAEGYEATICRIDGSLAAAWNRPAEYEADTQMFYWYVGAMIDPGLMRFAMFSYAVSTERLGEPEFEAELEMVQNCALTVDFPQDVPQ